MSQHGHDGDDDVLVLPPLPADPVFIDAVEEAVAGPVEEMPDVQPQRQVGVSSQDFASLYIRHRSSFGLHARRFLHDQRDIDEVLQEGFLRLFLAMPELENEMQALAYCRRTITNLCIDRYRAEQRRPRLVDLEGIDFDPSDESSYDDPVLRAEDAAIVREALALLSPMHRAALIKREIEEKPLPQIAAELDIPEDSVKHLLYRARRALRRLLVGTSVEPGVELSARGTLAIAHKRLARATVGGANVLIVMFVALLSVVVGLRPSVTNYTSGGGVLPPEVTGEPLGSPGYVGAATNPPRPDPNRTSSTRQHRPAGATAPTPAPNALAQVTPVALPAKSDPPQDRRHHDTSPARRSQTPQAAPVYSLSGSLTATGPVRVLPLSRVIDAANGTTATTELSAPTASGTFSLTQTVTQSSIDGVASVTIQPALINNGDVSVAGVASSSVVTRQPSGALTVDVDAKGVAGTELSLIGLQIHMVLDGDLLHVLSESVVVQTGDAASPPPVAPAPSSCDAAADTDTSASSVDTDPVTTVIGMSPNGSDDPLGSCSSTTSGGSSPLLPTPPVPVSEGRAASS